MIHLNETSRRSAFGAVVCLLRVAFTTHGQSADNFVQQWGAATNGLRLGLAVHLRDSWDKEQIPQCIVLAQNVSSNRVIWRLATESPENIRLFLPCGQELPLRRNSLPTINRKRHPAILAPGGFVQLKSFYLTNLFDVKTNGR